MRVLLSIKPEFVWKIFSGVKKYEFRKKLFKNTDVTTVVIYASAPVKKVVGEFSIDRIITLSPDDLWELTREHAGITEDFFFDYFRNRRTAHAIKVKRVKRYRKPLNIAEAFDAAPPQSFMYV